MQTHEGTVYAVMGTLGAFTLWPIGFPTREAAMAKLADLVAASADETTGPTCLYVAEFRADVWRTYFDGGAASSPLN